MDVESAQDKLVTILSERKLLTNKTVDYQKATVDHDPDDDDVSAPSHGRKGKRRSRGSDDDTDFAGAAAVSDGDDDSEPDAPVVIDIRELQPQKEYHPKGILGSSREGTSKKLVQTPQKSKFPSSIQSKFSVIKNQIHGKGAKKQQRSPPKTPESSVKKQRSSAQSVRAPRKKLLASTTRPAAAIAGQSSEKSLTQDTASVNPPLLLAANGASAKKRHGSVKTQAISGHQAKTSEDALSTGYSKNGASDRHLKSTSQKSSHNSSAFVPQKSRQSANAVLAQKAPVYMTGSSKNVRSNGIPKDTRPFPHQLPENIQMKDTDVHSDQSPRSSTALSSNPNTPTRPTLGTSKPIYRHLETKKLIRTNNSLIRDTSPTRYSSSRTNQGLKTDEDNTFSMMRDVLQRQSYPHPAKKTETTSMEEGMFFSMLPEMRATRKLIVNQIKSETAEPNIATHASLYTLLASVR